MANTYTNLYVDDTATREAAAADRAASNKTSKYAELSKSHHFTPIAIETGGSWNDWAIEFINELGQRITAVTQETREAQYLLQRMSVALQRGTGVAFEKTFQPSINFSPSADYSANIIFNFTIFKPMDLCLGAIKKNMVAPFYVFDHFIAEAMRVIRQEL